MSKKALKEVWDLVDLWKANSKDMRQRSREWADGDPMKSDRIARANVYEECSMQLEHFLRKATNS